MTHAEVGGGGVFETSDRWTVREHAAAKDPVDVRGDPRRIGHRRPRERDGFDSQDLARIRVDRRSSRLLSQGSGPASDDHETERKNDSKTDRQERGERDVEVGHRLPQQRQASPRGHTPPAWTSTGCPRQWPDGRTCDRDPLAAQVTRPGAGEGRSKSARSRTRPDTGRRPVAPASRQRPAPRRRRAERPARRHLRRRGTCEREVGSRPGTRARARHGEAERRGGAGADSNAGEPKARDRPEARREPVLAVHHVHGVAAGDRREHEHRRPPRSEWLQGEPPRDQAHARCHLHGQSHPRRLRAKVVPESAPERDQHPERDPPSRAGCHTAQTAGERCDRESGPRVRASVVRAT